MMKPGGVVIRCRVHDDHEVAGRVDVTFVRDDMEGEASVYLPIARDDVQVVSRCGPQVSEWDEWLIEAAREAYDREHPHFYTGWRP